ncbi:MAG: hypothetical protein NWF14_09665 [Candidatus Bathyarchaeota archaeon]|nr:hypothetical protein [Candidatus Bathyarchaeota archaeon]
MIYCPVAVLSVRMFMRELMRYIDSNTEKFVDALRILCRQPSISAQNKGIDGCVDVKVVPVKNGNPVVFGELKNKNSSG